MLCRAKGRGGGLCWSVSGCWMVRWNLGGDRTSFPCMICEVRGLFCDLLDVLLAPILQQLAQEKIFYLAATP